MRTNIPASCNETILSLQTMDEHTIHGTIDLFTSFAHKCVATIILSAVYSTIV